MIPGIKGQSREEVLELIQQGRLESACALVDKNEMVLYTSMLSGLIDTCLKHAESLKKEGDIRAFIQIRRRVAALTMLKDVGRLLDAVIPSVVLPEGYCGKILLASVKGGLIRERTFLRSGDDWHREIMRSFEEEVHDFGFENFQVSPRGGAFTEFQLDGKVILSGSSEEFGMCSREEALSLVKDAFPDRDVCWSDAEIR